ncbi:MAG TPA: FAD-dependent oxidoreductase [Planctomycetota bacterium]|nr:FAD-dependent oxidoreductase [Planctomycetota bacterium]
MSSEPKPAAAPIGSQDPRLPPPLPPTPPKVWTPRAGKIPTAKPQGYFATLDELLQPTPDVRLFRFTLDDYSEIMPFQAGQFIQMLCPVPDREKPGHSKNVIRSYSIASPPEEKRFLEFCIKLVIDGAFTPTLWNLRVGDKMALRGPYGKFVVPEPVQNDLVFIAAGTGIAPFWGMIYHLLHAGVKSDIVLLFGIRYEDDVIYEKEFKELAAKHPNFKPVFTLSRPRNPATWWGEKGYVQTLLPKYVKNPKNTKAYICGLTPMIEASVEELHKLGIGDESIHYERYD